MLYLIYKQSKGDLKMSKNEKTNKQREANVGLKKLTEEQKNAIKKLYDENDPRFLQVEKLVNKTVLFQITNDNKYAPKVNRSIRAEQLNAILFS